VWSVRDGTCRKILSGFEGRPSACVFSRDGRMVGVNADWVECRIWEVQTGECVITLTTESANAESARVLGFSEDCSRAYTVSWVGSRKSVDLATGQATYLEQISPPEPTDLRLRMGDLILIKHASQVVVEDTRWPWRVFYLWEFWLTVAFAGVFVWSVVRDRRALKVAADE